MFLKIFLFEIQNRVRRPAVYLYFAAALIFTIGSFATGSLPAGEKEHYNAPFLIALWCSGITMMMMLVTSSVMGTPLFRDIEYNTRDYYLTYPISKTGYFWGRFLGSFVCMLFISSAILAGIFIGSKLGPAMGWRSAGHYGPNKLWYYLYPYFTIALPNLIFTSCLFFGLVAITRNVKVIYSGGILLFLGYFISVFFLNHTNNANVIILADPFGLSGIRYASSGATTLQQNTTVLPVTGTYLWNRIIWSAVGLVVIFYTFVRFNFEKFFNGKRDKAAIDEVTSKEKRKSVIKVKPVFSGSYNRKTLVNLAKVELKNIISDNYFWIILSCGLAFLGFVFWLGDQESGVPYFSRTVLLLSIFHEMFPFFIFFIIIFYTGETLHRDRVTRYAFINDSLPPPNWVLNGSKLIALLILGTGLSLIPVITGITIQIAKGFFEFNFAAYADYLFVLLLPKLLAMAIFSYFVHVLVNSKFVAHGIGIASWVVMFFLQTTGIFNYDLLLYSFTPESGISDMDGLGHMMAPILWFGLYWLLFGGLLIIIAALFYYRGVISSARERLKLARERFDTKTKIFTVCVLIPFLAVGAFVYYNVSYLNDYTSRGENDDRAVIYERSLKHFDSLPLPKIRAMKIEADMYPDKQQQFVHAFISVTNKNNKPISQLLLDGDELSDYSIKQNGVAVAFTTPLIYKRGMFNWFRPKNDTADFRLYTLSKPLAPGDSTVLELNSSIVFKGFRNGIFAERMLRNGSFFTGGMPGLGYDDDDELNSPYERKKNHLPEKKPVEIAQHDPRGISTLKAGKVADLFKLDLTISTSGDQTVIASGELKKQWQQNGRNYFHYVQNQGMYGPLAAVSAKYAVKHDTVQQGRKVDVNIYYDPRHNANINRFMAGYKDGLKYFSSVFGDYPFQAINYAETSQYSPRMGSFTGFDTNPEYFGWNANFNDPNQTDYCYATAVELLAQQWWRFQVAPNATVGSLDIPEGLAKYCTLVMMEKKYGKNNMKWLLQDQIWPYIAIRRRLEVKENPLIRSNQWFEWGGKAAVVMYGLRDLIGDDNINAALREFKNDYAFKNKPPFAGANDLYRYLQKHTPDSVQYYLTDSWQKITLYDNHIDAFKAIPAGKNNWKVTLKFTINKVYIDAKGNDLPAKQMNDYLDVGVFAADTKNKEGRNQVQPLYLVKQKLTYGEHMLTFTVKSKPVRAGIDPFNKLINRMPNTMKDLE